MPDRFPEAFARFEQTVDVDRIQSFRQLRMAFGLWAGQKWQNTPMQMMALSREAKKLGIPAVIEKPRLTTHVPQAKTATWRHETVTVRGSSQQRYRDLKSGRFIRKP